MGKHKCVCTTEFCREDGGEATIRMPTAPEEYKEWCVNIFGEGQETLPVPKSDPRVSAAHFPRGSLVGSATCSAPGGDNTVVRLAVGALPSLTSDEMTAASRGALGRNRKLEAVNKRHHQAILAGALERQHLQQDLQLQALKISQLETELEELKVRIGVEGGGGRS